ncbi:hypothetical protein BANRA_00420 [Klebsiella pneumoniae]|nr:hypothetical protein BANRA_02206 [Klebsiella pneumoniae]VCV42380.1 hypothetical protein BANRA_02646 [Klebsiella pneumoniae]VCX21307.1 hypothetical protein BANRA_00888 [Klebsiella pneumoniae]VCX58862.1 hypothetical protein BANRA_00476 [Klebsiella pneumoniae]VCY02297.1 hypothetical protein BANRA_01390 [Klebsiella pneumoniae]
MVCYLPLGEMLPSGIEILVYFSYIKVTYLHYDLMFDSFKSHNHILNHDVPFYAKFLI